MRQLTIDSSRHPLFGKFKALYETSFPIFEQRTATQQEDAFQDERYRLLAFEEGHEFVGFISCWQFAAYCYVEHFAISAHLRGKGYGSRLLQAFVEQTPTMVILEIDPVIDKMTEARLRFYKACHFAENAYEHHHPPYRDGFQPHPLTVLSSGRTLTDREFRTFQTDLRRIVMRKDAKGEQSSPIATRNSEQD